MVSNRDDNTVSLIDAKSLRVRATLPVCRQPEDIAILPDSSKAFVACSGSSQVASIALRSDATKTAEKRDDRVLALLDVGRTPVSLTLKPDGGELIVCDFDSDSISIIETGNDEVGSTRRSGSVRRAAWLRSTTRGSTSPTSARTASQSTTLIWAAASATLTVGSRPDGLALTPDQNYLLVLDTQSGDVTVIQKRKPRKLEPTEYSLLTLIPVGVQPNAIVVKSFMVSTKKQ